MNGALEVTSGSGWSGSGVPPTPLSSSPLLSCNVCSPELKEGKKLTLEKKSLYKHSSAQACAFVRVRQAMCEQICVGASICVGRLQDRGEVVGL